MNFRYPNSKILLFTKAPIPGKCKTRLIPALGEEAAALLQENLLFKIINDLQQFCLCPFEIWESKKSEYFAGLNFDVPLKIQCGNDLGERMHNALKESLASCNNAIIIGSDCAEFTQVYLETALNELRHHDIVIGPAYDGGYLLMGMSATHPQIFHNIQWGTSSVLKQTRSLLSDNGLSFYELETLHDIDIPDDLGYLDKNMLK